MSFINIIICVGMYRKISAHEFERGGLLKPIVNTIDGTPTFLSVDTQSDQQCMSSSHGQTINGGTGTGGNSNCSGSGMGCGVSTGSASAGGGSSAGGSGGTSSYPSTLGVGLTAAGRPQRLSRNELKQLDEKQLIFELVS